MKKRKIILPFLLAGILASAKGGLVWQEAIASENEAEPGSGSAASGTAGTDTVQSNIDTADMFTDRDKEVGYDEEESTVIEFFENGPVCDSGKVTVSKNTVSITQEGAYLLRGTLPDGMVIVEAGDSDKVHLILDGAEITSSESAAIYIKSADKVFVTTAIGTENVLANGGAYTAIDDNNIDAVIFSKADLTLNGEGTLAINAASGHGIVSKDDLVLTSGTYEITAESHGLSGKDSVRIADGTYKIVSGKDGIHSENADDETKGFVYLADGNFDILAEGDGISAGSWLLAEGGAYTVKTGGGSQEAPEHTDEMGFGRNMWQTQTETEEDAVSTKGMKAGTELAIRGGSFTIDSADDAFHSNGNLTVNGGELSIACGDDGIHGDSTVAILGGSIEISQSYEGIEGLAIDITGGEITLTASDDGLNAAGGNDESGFGGWGRDQFAAQEGAYIHIAGGTLYIDASGDGIDSNGSLTVSGGETYVSGPTNDGNGALDYNGEASISGGIFVAAGSSGMAQNFGSASSQGAILATVSSQDAGSTIALTNSSGEELVSWQAEKEFNSVLVSCPEIVLEGEYTLIAGSDTQQITMESLVYGSTGQMFGSGEGGWMGMPKEDGRMAAPKEDRQDPPQNSGRPQI